MLHPLSVSEKTERAGPALPTGRARLLHRVPALPPAELLSFNFAHRDGCVERGQEGT